MMPERLSTCRDVARKKSGWGLDLGISVDVRLIFYAFQAFVT